MSRCLTICFLKLLVVSKLAAFKLFFQEKGIFMTARQLFYLKSLYSINIIHTLTFDYCIPERE